MIIIQLAGGLGNQLQQYALYRKFVCLGREARLDTSWFEKDHSATQRKLELAYFDRLLYEVCTREEKEILTGGEGIGGKLRRKLLPATVHCFQESKMYHPELLTFENMYISGYFACEKYYADILPDLREKIQFPPGMNPLNDQLALEMKQCQSVSLHVRRGDYLSPENAAMFGNICTMDYYKGAVEKIKTMVPDPQFYLFSDDVFYVKNNFTGKEYRIVDINHGKDSFYDMWLMSNCSHNICANSTFSFWGARLNSNPDKIMIRPAIHKNSQVFVKEEMQDLWPGWVFVDAQGKVK